MKKIFCLIGILILLFCGFLSAVAGSVPEDLLHHDGAQIFFGEVLSFTENGAVSVSPVKRIKGDILTGTKQAYDKANAVGDIDVRPGNVYLFTYFDENNPTDIFEVTSYDTKTLKLKNVTGDMWERFESYLNGGAYEKAERERINRLNAALVSEDDEASLAALFGVNKINCDKIEFSVFGSEQSYEIDKEMFWNLADEIRLKRINNILVSSENSFIICAFSGDEVHTVTMWDKCRVGSEKTGMYSAPTGDYIIKAADYEKLVGLFPIEAQPNLPKIKSAYANFVYWAMDHPTWMYIICAVIVFVFIGTVGFAVGYYIRKKKRTNSR